MYMLLVVNHYACMALTTVLSQHFCCYVDRFLLGLVFWATISVVLLDFVPHYINFGIQFLSKLNMI